MTDFPLERYLNTHSAYGASFGPDGTLAFLLDTTGAAQVWTLEGPRAWPRQRTFGDEPVGFVSFSPERPEMVFSKDDGGDERAQLFRIDDTGHVHELTGMPDAKHRWGGWSHDGDRIAFTSNRRDEEVFDVYVQGRADSGQDARLVREGDGWLSLGGWSPDDTRLLLSEAHSNFDQDLYVLDVDSGERTHITPHEGSVRHRSADWGPDGESVYCVSDMDTDTLELVRIGLDSGNRETDGATDGERRGTDERGGTTRETVETGGEWNVGGVALDTDTGRVVYSRNVDGYTDLTAGELAGPTTIETYPDPDLPGGISGGVSWGPEAERFAVTTTGRTENTNVFVVETTTGESERWTDAGTAGIPRESFVAPELVRYESFDGRAIPAFFSLPPEVPDGGAPTIVDIHGGPESQRRPSFSGLTQYFLSRGYAVFEPNVRGSSGYGKAYTHLDDVEKRMDSVKDIRAAVDWLADHDAVDADRLVAKGGSYGGFMVLSAMTEYPELWAAGVDVVGIANFVTFLENTGSWRRQLREAEYGSLAEDREFLESISPLNHAENIAAPLFVIHGANDPRVPLGEAEQIVEAVRERDIPVELRMYDDEGHGLSKRENRIDAYTDVVAFLDDHV